MPNVRQLVIVIINNIFQCRCFFSIYKIKLPIYRIFNRDFVNFLKLTFKSQMNSITENKKTFKSYILLVALISSH